VAAGRGDADSRVMSSLTDVDGSLSMLRVLAAVGRSVLYQSRANTSGRSRTAAA
jgi:hypothetical protein